MTKRFQAAVCLAILASVAALGIWQPSDHTPTAVAGPLVSASRIREIWTGTTTSTITLSGTAVSGPPGGYRRFLGAASDTFDYRILIEHRTAAEWMIGRFTYSSGSQTLTYVSTESSHTGSQVTFSAGTKHIAVVVSGLDAYSPFFYAGAEVYGNLSIGGGASASHLALLEPSGSGGNYTGFKSPALAADVIYTLPTADGTANYKLTTDGSKNLSWGASREMLTANRTYYVRTDGSDSNTGLANTAGGAFLTVQKAVDVACALDLSVYSVTIDIETGTYTGAVILKSYVGAGPILITGDATPANVVISTTSADCFSADAVRGKWQIGGVKMATTTSGSGIYAANGSIIEVTAAVDYGACATYHNYVDRARITFAANYNVTAGAQVHWGVFNQGYIQCTGRTITITNTPAFTYWAYASGQAYMYLFSNTYTGSATGTRYFATVGGIVDTLGAATTTLPGNAAGTPAAADTASASLGLYH